MYPNRLYHRSILTLLVVLFFLLACGWDRPPPTANIIPEADIVRIMYYRDTVYSYARWATVNDKTFNLYRKDIADVLVRLGGACYQNAINSIKTECMNTNLEKYCQELLKNWFPSRKEKIEQKVSYISLLRS